MPRKWYESVQKMSRILKFPQIFFIFKKVFTVFARICKLRKNVRLISIHHIPCVFYMKVNK